MVELRGDTLTFSFPEVHEHAVCSLSFQRTLRIPDDEREHFLPPGLGCFPLHHVDDHADRLPDRWGRHGGVFMPMYQAEALWLNLGSTFDEYPMAVMVAAGKIDALTGKPFSNALRKRSQNYLVAPDQPWLDGFCVSKGLVRQFVAMPLGKGYTAEEQLTGAAEHGGVQIVVYPMKAVRYEQLQARRLRESPRFAVRCASPANDAMGLAPGGKMRQEIYKDAYGFDAWDQGARSRCFVHLLNSGQYRAATGAAPPHEPPTAADYTAAGLPWFEYYDADLERLDSVAARAAEVRGPTPDAGASVEPEPGQVKRLTPRRRTIREGDF